MTTRTKKPMNAAAASKKAYRLWLAYKTQTPEYEEIARFFGISVLDLNSKNSHMRSAKLGFGQN